ncbi:MAG: hypothetical protein FJX89_09030 [Bacteroidetes bacterium]|nr:hypothetical protein [Bacteroidota bacterium]
MRLSHFLILSLACNTLLAQEDTTDTFDYSQFGDAQGVKRYCNQKVLNQTPTRIVSIGYEYLGEFHMPGIPVSAMLPALRDFHVNRVGSIRAQVNIPVVSTNQVIWQLGASFWGSRFALDNQGNDLFAKVLNTHTMTSVGINTTIFKPLNEKNFIILQGSLDANGIFHDMGDVSGKALTVSGTAIYGWKTSEKNMIGTGIARTYRAGQVIHVPVLLWNRTFNDRWGMELLLPARGHIRYNFSTSSMLQAGFELEGNQFWMNLANSPKGMIYLQRGELKPRIMWDKKLAGFIWLNAQAGLRYNWRFDAMNEYKPKYPKNRYFTSNLGNPVYFAVSLSFVTP